MTVSVAVLATLPLEAVTVTIVAPLQGRCVLTVAEARIAPAGTVTVEGTAAVHGREEVSVTIAPPLGAGAVSVTVAVEELPPTTRVGLSAMDASAGAVVVAGLTVRRVLFVTPA